MHFEHLGWGLQITAFGMGLVFALLALLWGLLTLVLRLDRVPAEAVPGPAAAMGPQDEAPAAPQTVVAVGAPDGDAPEPALIAAITAAVLCHIGSGRRGRDGATPEERVHWPGSLLHASRWVAAGRLRQTRHWQRRR
jgi:glutaconyl-CoA/methylmalonyl-CoA decarboxylase subunit delta